MTRLKKFITVTFTAGMVLILAYASWPIRVLEVSLPREGDQFITGMRVSVGDPVLIQYRHSVELTQVEGLFSIGSESGIVAVETRFESAGTGLPGSFPEKTIRRDGWWVVNEGNRPIGAFRFYIVPINNVRLTVCDRDVPIVKLIGSSALVQIRSYKTAHIVWMLRTSRALNLTRG